MRARRLCHRPKGARFKQVVHRSHGVAVVLRRAAFPRQAVAVPAVQRETTPQLALLALMLVAVPLRAGLTAWLVMCARVLEQSPAQGIVGKLHRQSRILEMHQAAEQVPAQATVAAVMPTLNLVASVVLFVMGTGVLTQQVVHQLGELGVLAQRAVGLLRSVIQQVAGRIERKGLHPQLADGTQQPANRVVAIRQRPPPGVVDIRKLTRRVAGYTYA